MYSLKFLPDDRFLSDKTSYCYQQVTEDFVSGYLAPYLGVTEFDTQLVEVTYEAIMTDDELESIVMKYDKGECEKDKLPNIKTWNGQPSTILVVMSDGNYGHIFCNVTLEFRKGLSRFMSDLGTANGYEVLHWQT